MKSHSVSLRYTSICAGIVVAVTFHKVDYAPNAETGTQGDHQGLKNADSRIEKCHGKKKEPPMIQIVSDAFSCCFTDQSSCWEDNSSPDRSIVST